MKHPIQQGLADLVSEQTGEPVFLAHHSTEGSASSPDHSKPTCEAAKFPNRAGQESAPPISALARHSTGGSASSPDRSKPICKAAKFPNRAGQESAPPILRSRAFTLVEILIATAILALLAVLLTSISDQVASIWSRNQNQSELRDASRMVSELMQREMSQAILPLYKDSQTGPRFVINPKDVGFQNRDTVFWQAPIATDNSKGDLAIVGYFVNDDRKLCRLFVNPNDDDYDLTSLDAGYIKNRIADKVPANESSNFQGVVLDNVLGMWVTAYTDYDAPVLEDPDKAEDSGNLYSQYDSRDKHALPNRVEVSFVLMDATAAGRLTSSLPKPGSSSSAKAYVEKLEDSLRSHVKTTTFTIPFL